MLSDSELREIEEEIAMASKLSSDTCDGCKASEIVQSEMLSRLSALQIEASEHASNTKKWHDAATRVVQLCMPTEYRQWNDANFDMPIDTLDADEFIKVVSSLRSKYEDAKHSEILATAEAVARTRYANTAPPVTVQTEQTGVHTTKHWPTLTSRESVEQIGDSIPDEPPQVEDPPPSEPVSIPMAQGLDVLDDLIIYLFGQGGQPTLAQYNRFCAEMNIDAERLTLFIVRNGYFDFAIQKERGMLFPQVKLAGHLPRIQTHTDFQTIQGNINLWTELGRAGKNEIYVPILGDLCDRGFISLARIGDKNGHGEFFPGVIDGQSALLCIGYGEPPYIPTVSVTSRFDIVFLAAPSANIKDIPKLAGHTVYMSELDPIDWRN